MDRSGGLERGRLGLDEAVDADHDVLATLDAPATLGQRADQRALEVAGLDGGHHATEVEHLGQLGAGTVHDGLRQRCHHVRAGEDVAVLQQVRLVRQHLLQPQRPLLVPGPGQAERLVPRRELHRAGAGVAGQRDAQHLQDDPGDVVLRLRLGEPERVDLHAVAEPAHLRVFDAVPVFEKLAPQLAEGAHLRRLLDEANPGVDEERHPRGHRREVVHRAAAHLVEDGGSGRQSEPDLLDGSRASLLQVVRADVDGVPPGGVPHRPGDEIAGEPQRLGGREDVRPAREVLLDDVVLGGALQLLQRDALLPGDRDVEGVEPHRRCVDRHRGVRRGEVDAVEELVRVAEVGDRDADAAHLAGGEFGVRVVAGLGRQVERDRQAGLALGEIAAEECVAGRRRGVAGVGAHHPGPVRLRKRHGEEFTDR
jgi:hypothetical protein